MVPRRSDRAGERAGDRRPLRALRKPGGAAQPGAVVLPDHRVRGPPPGGFRRLGVMAGERHHDAAQLDRTLRGCPGHVPLRGAGHRLPGVHDSPGHPVRGDVLRHLARTSGDRSPGRRHRERGGGPRLRRRGSSRERSRARSGRPREDRRRACADGDESGQRRGDPDFRRRLRADGVRDRGDHGSARSRRARLRLRPQVRPAGAARRRGDGPGRGPGRRRVAVLRRRSDDRIRPLRRQGQPRGV